MKTEADLHCCASPTIVQVEALSPTEGRAKCSRCGTRWRFHDCAIDPTDGRLVAGSYSRPRRTTEIIAIRPPSAGRVLQLPKGKP